MTVFDEWFSRKLARRTGTLQTPITVEERFTKVYGPRADFAWVRLLGEPSQTFAYHCAVQWPQDPEAYNAAVLDAILDELLAMGIGRVVLHVRFTLEAIRWHEVDSNRQAFYHATRAAVRKILGLDTYPSNVEWE
jgi:hypothetical protein